MRHESRRPMIPWAAWVRRVGVTAGIFFVIKGLLWLIVPAWLAWKLS